MNSTINTPNNTLGPNSQILRLLDSLTETIAEIRKLNDNNNNGPKATTLRTNGTGADGTNNPSLNNGMLIQ